VEACSKENEKKNELKATYNRFVRTFIPRTELPIMGSLSVKGSLSELLAQGRNFQ
jgi:hypothetical protein